jgi:type I restriction modification DNA specificity domain protein
MRNKPRIRFKGFTEDWEQRKLDDIAKIKTGGGTPKTANPEYWSGNIPWIQSSDLVEGDIVHVNINKFINNNALKNSAAKLISRDSIALVTRVGVGKVAVINQDFTTSQDFLSLSDFDGNDIKFLAYQLYRLMQENAKVLQGTSIKGITKTELIEQSISIPSSGQEQNLISNVLSKIDSFITFHQRKLEKLKLAKKALLQKLFPKNGSKFPELRFKGFADAWEQRKVNEIFKVTRGQVLAASLTTPEKNRRNIYPVYSSQTKDNGLLGYYSEYLFENAITWTTDGANAGTVNFRPGRFYSTNVNGVLINENGYACYAVSEIINKVAYKYVSKVGNPKLMNNVMAEINIMITPDIDELKQISKLIEAYNQYITLHQRKLDKLQEVKKGLLQKMFV